ncbi:hypothetical protein B0H14DRAFT_3524804 [Mycena olivaceomarginata]|nr:hypothetical protein B0H14DRAFT_3524804 [Mycena olivaceomarginata]
MASTPSSVDLPTIALRARNPRLLEPSALHHSDGRLVARGPPGRRPGPTGRSDAYSEEQQDMTEIPVIEATSATGTWTKTAGIGWEDTPDATTAAVAIFAAEAQAEGWSGGPASARP